MRDVSTGEVMWEEFEDDGAVMPFAATRDRRLWAYVRTTRGEERGPGRVLVRGWPFDKAGPTLVTEKQHVGTLALSDTGELLALTDWPSIEFWHLAGKPVGSASRLRALEWPAISGTGEALDWHPQSGFLAHSGARRATVFSAGPEPFWSAESAYASDVRFTSDGALLAVGDWSEGAVYGWPPG